MRFWVGVTDRRWFEELRLERADEVNFWQPSPIATARFLEPGVPFLFKLHYPENAIVGGGFFVRFSVLPARLAWEAFGSNNGTQSYADLKARIAKYRAIDERTDPQIGCNLLCEPFFFDKPDWIPAPSSWKPNIVKGKTFDTADRDGQDLWLAVQARLGTTQPLMSENREAARYGAEFLARARLGQGAFRVLVTDAYFRKCAISGERTLPALEAAHIRPFASDGPHRVSNGLLLRADLHKLFDDGYVTVSDDLRVQVSPRIREEFENGREYYRFHGQSLAVAPEDAPSRPDREFLQWHNNERFKA